MLVNIMVNGRINCILFFKIYFILFLLSNRRPSHRVCFAIAYCKRHLERYLFCGDEPCLLVRFRKKQNIQESAPLGTAKIKIRKRTSPTRIKNDKITK